MIELIPAIDIIEGKCVRLSNGDYASKVVYGNNPVDIAIKLQAAGFKRLHVVDLDGAKSKHIVNHHILEEITSKTKLIVDFGGGIKSEEDIEIAFASGAAMITIVSVSVLFTLCNILLSYHVNVNLLLVADIALWTAANIVLTRRIRSASKSH